MRLCFSKKKKDFIYLECRKMVYKYIQFLYNFGDIQILSQKYSFKNIMYWYIVPNITLKSNYHFFSYGLCSGQMELKETHH